MQDKVTREIERTGRNLLITNVVVVTLTSLMLVSGYRYWYNFFCGPFKVDNAELAQLKNRASTAKYYVRIKGDKTFDTGVQEMETRSNRRTKEVESETATANYLVTAVDHRGLLVKAPVGTPGTATEFEGELKDVSNDEYNSLVAPMEKEGLPMLPVMLDVNNFKTSGFVGLFFGALFLGTGLWNLRKCITWRNEPEMHPLMKELRTSGDPRQMRTQLNDELNSAQTFSVGNLFLTKTWIGSKGMYDVRLVPIDHVVWVYKSSTKHSVNFIPTGTSHEVIVKTKDGKERRYPSNGKDVDKLVVSVADRAPWVIAGYSDELNGMWRKNWREMADAVQQRRSDWEKERKGA